MQLAEINKLGERSEKYGQRWWGKTNESLNPISFNSQSEFQVGDEITYEESEQKTSKKGTVYLQLKKVKKVQSTLPEGKPQQNAPESVSGLTKEQGDEIIRLLKIMAGESEKKVDEVPDGEVTLDDVEI